MKDDLAASHRRTAARRLIATAALAGMLSLPSPTVFALSYTCSSPNTQQPFTNASVAGTTSGSIQSFAVPASSVTIDAAGAQGGPGGVAGGLGAEVAATFSITSGQTLCVVVGVQGATEGIGGGGGGGSFVYAITSGTCGSNLASVTTSAAPNLLIAAGGGGGGGSTNTDSAGVAPSGVGTGNASSGASGDNGGGLGGAGGQNGLGGTGGGVADTGAGGGGLSGNGGGGTNGAVGGDALVHDADGGTGVNNTYSNGGYGGGGVGNDSGGGGGGYNGGGGGGQNMISGGGGGGGGSFIFSPATLINSATQSGVQSGNGAVNFCYNQSPAVPTLSWPALTMLVALLSAGLLFGRRRAAPKDQP